MTNKNNFRNRFFSFRQFLQECGMTDDLPPSEDVKKWIEENKIVYQKKYGMNEGLRVLRGRSWEIYHRLQQNIDEGIVIRDEDVVARGERLQRFVDEFKKQFKSKGFKLELQTFSRNRYDVFSAYGYIHLPKKYRHPNFVKLLSFRISDHWTNRIAMGLAEDWNVIIPSEEKNVDMKKFVKDEVNLFIKKLDKSFNKLMAEKKQEQQQIRFILNRLSKDKSFLDEWRRFLKRKQYLSKFKQIKRLKRIANQFGIDVDILEKKAFVDAMQKFL